MNARVLTEQTIAALERQLKAEHIKLHMLENVEACLAQPSGVHGGASALDAKAASAGSFSNKPRLSTEAPW